MFSSIAILKLQIVWHCKKMWDTYTATSSVYNNVLYINNTLLYTDSVNFCLLIPYIFRIAYSYVWLALLKTPHPIHSFTWKLMICYIWNNVALFVCIVLCIWNSVALIIVYIPGVLGLEAWPRPRGSWPRPRSSWSRPRGRGRVQNILTWASILRVNYQIDHRCNKTYRN